MYNPSVYNKIIVITARGVMRKLFIGLAFLSVVLSFKAMAQEDKTTALPKYFYKKLEGTIGEKYPVRMELIREDSVLRGYYYYENKRIPIPFTFNSCVDKNGNYIIEENAGNTSTGEQLVTGRLTGKFIDTGKFEGVWQNYDGSKTLPLKLMEKYGEDCAKINIRKYERNIGECGNESCFSLSIFYPEVILPDKNVEDKINKAIKNSLLEYYVEDKALQYNSIEELADSFYAAYKTDSVIIHSEDYILAYVYDLEFKIDYNDNNILSLLKTLYTYTGGAHGSTSLTYLNFDLRSGAEIKLEDIFKDDYKTALDKLGEKPFRDYYNLKPDEDFEKAGFWFTDNKFSLNDNFGFNPEGIVFQYNQYEVAPYALGAASIIIPYKKLKEIVKENSLLDYINK
ncbi:MAG: DUF3298/DUF4163 domain-containing protein [Ignavibacteriales bacterium]|nr:MAG: DUF3298/DUF4163 domain-containing protein [Ignavibacteriales bacterium]